VTPGPLRFPDIQAAIDPIAVCGSTPTGATLRNVLAYLVSAPTGHAAYVLLVTDGVPNCNSSLDPATCTCLATDPPYCEGYPESCLDDVATYAAIDALLAADFRTYVMALGRWMGSDRDVLDAMAVHGGTAHFYPAEDTASILTTFEEIMGTIVLSCTFDLHPTGDVDPTQVNLYVGGEIVPQDPGRTEGWNYVDEDTVEFYGTICDTILSGDVTSVSAGYGCPTFII
jgi:hypothetical protein